MLTYFLYCFALFHLTPTANTHLIKYALVLRMESLDHNLHQQTLVGQRPAALMLCMNGPGSLIPIDFCYW